MTNHGYEPQGKPWTIFRSKLLVIIPSALRDCSTYKFQFTSFLKFESHNKLFSGRKYRWNSGYFLKITT
jgi:hypothetical protein